MEEPSSVVSAVHFRHFGPDNVRQGNRNCCAVVDICTNNDADIKHNECLQLFHLHWEDPDIGSEMSSITVSEADGKHKSTVITPDLVDNLLKDQAALHDFIRKMLTVHQVQLIHVQYAPLVLTFQHCRGSDRSNLLRERFKAFIIVKEFILKATGLQDLKGLTIGIHRSESFSLETGLWCRYFHRAYRDVSAQRSRNSSRGEPKKETIEGNETKGQALRLMIECAIGNSPHWSRIWKSAEEALLEEECPAPRYDLALDTVICLDTSGSMRGEAFQEMKKITLGFINGIEDIAEQHDVEENIALVTYGGRAKVIHHLSNDYGSLRDALEKITPRGPSPIHEGLVVSMAALAKGGVYRINNRMELRPRMIFLTDGHPTTELPETAKDSQWLSVQDQNRIVLAFREIRSRQPSDDLPDEIIFVPVGQSCNRGCIETLALACEGKVKDVGSFLQLSKFNYLRKVAAQAIGYVSSIGNESDIFVAGLRSLFSNLGPDIDRASTMEIYKEIEAYITSISYDINEEPGLPPLGTRVVRGPDWEWGNQDTEGPGTIYNHAKHSIVWVIWDTGHSNYYRYGHDGKYDVTVVEDQPRVLSGYLVALGVQVERGPGWHRLYGNQDGGHGSYGTIIRLTPGRVKVRWKNGNINDYRYGMCGMVDIAIRDPIACILETTAKANPHMGTNQDAVSSKEGDRPYIWQREDKQNGWEPYSEANDAKLKKAYGKNSTGSCLVQIHEESFRVSFKSLQERSLTDKSWVRVRKHLQEHEM